MLLLNSKNECVELNFGQQPFRFDLEGMIAEEQEAAAAAVSAVPLCHGAVHRLVRQYLVHYAYADTLAAFDAAAGLGGSDDDADGGGSAGGAKAGSGAALAAAAATATLQLRHSVRKRVMAGDVEAAVQLIEAQCPELLQQQQPQASSGPRPSGSSMDVDLDVGGAGSPPAQEAATSGSGSSSSSNPYDEVGFHVNCQRYVELLRRGEVDAAVRFAQATLAPYRERLPHLEPVLRDVVALVAYAQPAESPLAHLLSASQREFVADAANAALLAEARRKASAAAAPATGGATASTSAAGRSALERALAQLATVHGVLHEQNGSQGAPFRLSDHLLLPAQPDGAGGAAAPSQPMMVDP